MKYLGRSILRALGRFFSTIFNIKLKLKYVIIFCILLGGGTYWLTYSGMMNKVGGKDDFDEAMRYIEIKDIVDERYIDPVDRKNIGYYAAAAMVSGLGDSWSVFMTPDEYRAYQLTSSNDYADIGMTLIKDETNGGFQVLSVSADSPAAKASPSALGVGMIITAVDGEKIANYSLDDVRTLIRSKLNGKFVLEISGTEYLTVDCTDISTGSVVSRMEKTGAGYVQIKNFEAGSGQLAMDAIESLLAQGATALVIDLRNNSGGLTAEIASLLDYLLPKGRIFSEADKNGDQMPMCVLVNGQTFREAELCAAVLQEFGWASVLGEPTTGNTRTQEVIPLEDGSALRLSTRSYLTANGVDIAKNGGVIPDMIVFNTDESATGTTEGTTGGEDGTASTSGDEQLMTALKMLS